MEAGVAIVTGGAHNIGYAIARRLGAEGFTVALLGRDTSALESAARALESEGISSLWARCDVADEGAVAQAVTTVTDADRGPLAVLVNNAVVRRSGPLVSTSLTEWNEVLGVALTGSFLMTREVLPHLTARGSGRIINIAGISGEVGAADRAAIVAAKSGVIGLTKAAALEAAPHGVTVNAVSPGIISTDRHQAAGAKHPFSIPLNRAGRAEEVASLCAYLCTEDAGYITGQLLSVNGGATR